jgi:hypothetical protein
MILLNLPESPLLCMGMNGSPERGGGTEAQVVGFKEAPPFGRGASRVPGMTHRPPFQEKPGTTKSAVTGRKDDANKARA